MTTSAGDLMADVRLARAGPSRDGKGFDIDLLVPHEISALLVHSFRAILDEHGDAAAPNYVEMAVDYEGDRYAVIVLRPDRKTPHQLRAEAEEMLRQHVMDWGECSDPARCTCSHARALRMLGEVES